MLLRRGTVGRKAFEMSNAQTCPFAQYIHLLVRSQETCSALPYLCMLLPLTYQRKGDSKIEILIILNKT